MSWADNCQRLMKFAHEQSLSRSTYYQSTYQIWWKSIEIYSSYCPESKIQLYCGQITLSKIDSLSISNLKADLHNINAIHIPSLVKIHWYLLKLLSRNENSDMSQTDNCQKLMKLAHQQSPTRSSQYQCTQCLVKIHWYLLKLSSRNENMIVLHVDNSCQKLMKFVH